MPVSLRRRLVGFADALRRWLLRLAQQHADPSRLGAAVAFGVWLGCTPFYGFQTLLGLGLAPVLRLNRLGVFLGLQISIPPIAPFLLFASAQLGSMLLRQHWLPLSIDALRALPTAKLLADLFADLLVGGTVVGVLLAVPAWLLTTYLVRKSRTAKQNP